jgi:hypothetical protein
VIRPKISEQIDDAAECYRKEKGALPKLVALTQDEYLQLGAEIGNIVHSYRGMRIIVRWGKTSNKAISL